MDFLIHAVPPNAFFVEGSSAYIGIGTNAPLTTLDVRGDISGSGSFLGTGVGNRITNNGTPYLLSGDSPAETQTLQDVTTNGNTTTTSIISTGPHISGVTGLFSDKVGIGITNPAEKLELGAGGKIGLKDSGGTYDSVIYNDGTTFKVANGAGSYHVDKVNILGLLDLGVGHTIKGIDNSIIANKDILAPKDGSFGFRTYGATNQYDAISSQFIDNNNNALSFNVKAGGTTSEAIRIDKDGKVGVGITGPSYPLEVAGTGTVSIAYQRTGVSAKKWGFHSDNTNTYWHNITDNVLALEVIQEGVDISTYPHITESKVMDTWTTASTHFPLHGGEELVTGDITIRIIDTLHDLWEDDILPSGIEAHMEYLLIKMFK